ncbi:hypothetical protein FACS189493_3960 [Spirochaetia bacterium]|nr:hypothetical protein FACS189493_3960 [Spirochaetia bacterium]
MANNAVEPGGPPGAGSLDANSLPESVLEAQSLAAQLIHLATEAGLTIAAAESCTSGLVADLLASAPGASAVFWGSFVTYTLDAKTRMLGVDDALLRQYGAVSRETALAMARCAREKSGAGAAVSVTGLAGPDGDGSVVPVGSVWIGLSIRGAAEEARLYHFAGSRNEVRHAAARQALRCLFQAAGKKTWGTATGVEN